MESFNSLLSSFCIFILSLIHVAAAAVLAPNMSSCHLPTNFPVGEPVFSCCPPTADYEPRLFTPNFSSSPLRVRRPAHAVDEAYAAKLARAYSLMKALPANDPRSFIQQANIHCAYCNGVYNQINSSLAFQVHGCWLFFSFHRWYLYFHERILGKLLGEDDFAIPFWNYDNPDGSAIPWLYSTYNLTLVDVLRDANHAPPFPAAIDFTWDTDRRTKETQLRENSNAMYRSLIRDATSKQNFFGVPYHAGEPYPIEGFGTVEKRPHNTLHIWVGQKSQIGWKDMGTLYAAGRDPVFYAHHAQVDRLWELWRAMPNNYNYEDAEYLDAEFLFYNEDAELVRVKVRDSLESTELGYVYEEVENKWMEAVPERRSEGEAKLTENNTVCVEGERITGPCSMVMERDVEAEGEYMEVAVEYSVREGVYMDVYINLPSAKEDTDSGCEEYLDFMLILPGFLSGDGVKGNATKTVRTWDMRERLEALELTEAATIIVTLVPRPYSPSSAFLSLVGSSIIPLPSYKNSISFS